MRKVLGLYMEASGLAALAESYLLDACYRSKRCSDFGDKFKDDRYRVSAARAAAEALFVLLRNTAQLLLPKSIVAVQTESGHLASTSTSDTRLPLDLIDTLAELYRTYRMHDIFGSVLVERGVMLRISEPRDLWQRLWQRCCQGAEVTPQSLLTAALDEFPSNVVIITHIHRLSV